MPKCSRTKKASPASAANSSALGGHGEAIIELDPSIVYFTFSRIRPCFSCGRTIQSTLEQFQSQKMRPTDLPLISVFTDGTHYYSQNNRRLFMYKKLREMDLLHVIPVRVRALPTTKRMGNKYTPSKCSLTATLIRERNIGTNSTQTPTHVGGNSEDEKEKEKEEESEGVSPCGKASLASSSSSFSHTTGEGAGLMQEKEQSAHDAELNRGGVNGSLITRKREKARMIDAREEGTNTGKRKG
ncbi:unnamed protein product [Phytomonas sp. EM1]|nr:unnamed protein product [Phytomonas sp. EM1]|eukprot:CCW60780.1 unnamed protein product [Phytomonas sp. isolate EM1]